MERRDAGLFSGRRRELAEFDRVLAGVKGDEPSVILLHGPGGIGKSSLAREMGRRARGAGLSVHWIDGREPPPVPDALEDALAEAGRAARPMVVLDSYERIAAVGRYLRQALLPGLPDRALVVIASRGTPEPGWLEGGWEALTMVIELVPLDEDESLALARALGVEAGEAAAELAAWSGGSPLALSFGARVMREERGWAPGQGPERHTVLEPMIRQLTDIELRGTHLERSAPPRSRG